MNSRLYFSYGNNMRDETMRKRVGAGNYKKVKRARLRNHRLTFSTDTSWPGGRVADVSYHPRFAVYGVLYEVTDEAYQLLAPHEPTYEIVQVEVEVFGLEEDLNDPDVLRVGAKETIRSPKETLFVDIYYVRKKKAEAKPSPQYLSEAIIPGSREAELPSKYVAALESFLEWDNEKSFVAIPTKDRGQGKPLPIVQVSAAVHVQMHQASYVMVEYAGRKCIAELQERSDLTDLQDRLAGVDENLRMRLGLPAIEPAIELYGVAIKLTSVGEEISPHQIRNLPKFLQPRYLLLATKKAFSLDAEKDICVIDKSALELLGGEVGDYVRITVYPPGGGSRSITRRAMHGETGRWDHADGVDYPEKGSLHIDAADRGQLGLYAETYEQYRDAIEGYPALVSISVTHLIRKRMLVYVFSLLAVWIGFTAAALRVYPNLNGTHVVLASLAAAFILVALVVHNDVANKVRP